MKAKILSILVMLMMACNVMAQYDFMTLHFNNDSCPSRRFYWPDVTKFTQSKYDKDGVLHDSYQTQEIWIRDSIYSYSLMDIDSITFTKFNKEEAKRNFISAMNSTTKLTYGCKTITEVESVLDQLNGSEGVERAWIDGTTLHVTSINGYTIHFYYDLIKPEENDTNDSEPYNIPEYKFFAPAWGQDYSYMGYKPRVLFINLLNEDDSFSDRSEALKDLENAFNFCNIETTYITKTELRSSSEEIDKDEFHFWEKNIFEYDKVIYNAHGGYSSENNSHDICLSNELGRKVGSEAIFDQKTLDDAYEKLNHIQSQYKNCTEQDIDLGGIHFWKNGIQYVILCPSITESFFDKYATGYFDRDKDPIVFAGSCHSLDGNDNDKDKMAQVFLGRGAKVFLGYKNSNNTSQYAAYSFFFDMLKGKTVKAAYDDIPDSYREEYPSFERFKFVPGGILEPRYSNEKYGSNLRLANTFTKDVDFETARAEFISNKKVTISGVTGIVNPSDPDIEYGFRYGILKNDLNKTIKASEHHYSTTEPLGNFSFSAKLDMSEYQNYYYQAYTCYDDSYCYGDIYQIIFYLIKEIYLDPTSATLKVGESLTIKATFNPANPPNKELDWESSDPSIATVSHGIVNAKSVGHATITAKATDGSGVTATCEIEVVDDHVNPITLSQTEVTLAPSSTTTVEITSGNGDYSVSVDKPSFATATLSGTTITIKGESKGTAKVTVKDKSGQTAEINVNVWDNLTLSQSSVDIYAGYSATVEITSGSGHYSVSVDKPAIATASLSGSVITIKGVGVGSAVVTVTDTSTNQTAKINVTVSSAPTLVVSNSSVELMVGGSSIVEITSGSGSYEISNSNVNVAQAVLDGTKITLTAKAEGNAVVTVKDKATGQTASISVTVNSIANLVLSQSNVNLAIGGEAIVEIVSGSGDYSVAVDKPAVATATLSGTKITIKGIATGTAKVTVKDKSGQTAEITVSVYTKDELIIPLSVVDLTIGAETTVEIVLGSGDYSVAVDDSDIATASISGSIIKIYGVGVGTTIVTVTDNVTNQKKGIFVNVSLSYVPANAIDLGLPSGTKWASWNVGASAPGDCGGYYAWGETETKEYYGWDTYEYFNNETFEFQYIGDDIAGTEYDVAHVKWGGGWRMPTDNQMHELYHCCTWTWTSMWSTNGYSHTGFLVTGPNGNSIFLPAAGYCLGDDPTPYDLCSKGHYWSSEMSTNYEYIMYDSVLSYFFYYNDNNWSSYYYGESNRYYGLSVRPVCP